MRTISLGFNVAAILSIITMVMVLGTGALAHPATHAGTNVSAQIDALLAETFKPDEPGAAVIVVRDGQVLLRKGYGMANLELGVPAAPETVFRLGSLTKQFTAVAILMLVEQGRVSLNDSITKYVLDYPTHGHTITIQHLLAHTSGIPSYPEMPSWPGVSRSDLAPNELIALFKDEPLLFAPGERWSYSDSGYVLLGAVIEKASGMSYAEFVQQRIFTPLGMAHSSYDTAAQIVPGRAAGYSMSEAGIVNAAYLSMTQPYAAGALASSVDDLARWDAALYTNTLLKQRTLRRAFQSATLADGQPTGYGYGWTVGSYAGHPIIAHNGDVNGFSTQMMRLPKDKVYIAILTNCDSCRGSLGNLAFRIATLVINTPYEDPPAVTLRTDVLASYEGTYQFNAQLSVTIRQADGQLLLETGGAPRVLTPLSAREFFVTGVPMRIRFVRDASGAVTELQLQSVFGPWTGAHRT